MKLSTFITTLAGAQLAMSSMIDIEKRGDLQFYCKTPRRCEASYTTGSGLCQSGFHRTELESPGSPLGSVCDRTCTDSERATCVKAECNKHEKQCNGYPRSDALCADAIEWCKAPIAMLKSTCTERIPRRLKSIKVTYDEAKHLCVPEVNPPSSRRPMPLVLGTGAGLNYDF